LCGGQIGDVAARNADALGEKVSRTGRLASGIPDFPRIPNRAMGSHARALECGRAERRIRDESVEGYARLVFPGSIPDARTASGDILAH